MELQSLLLFDRWMGGHHSSCEALAEQLEPGDQERLNCRNLAEKKPVNTDGIMPIAAIDSSSQRVLSTILIHFDLEENRLAKLRYQGDSACGSLSFTFS